MVQQTRAIKQVVIRRLDRVPPWTAWLIGGVPGLLLASAVLGLEGAQRLVAAALLVVAVAALAWWLGAHVRLSRVGLPPPRPVTRPVVQPLEDQSSEGAGESDEVAPPAAEPPPVEDPLLDMVPLPGGTFWMGSDRAIDPTSYQDEQPRHKVRLSPFLMARTPVTRGLWRRVMSDQAASEWRRTVPSQWNDGDDDLPATHVRWPDAVAFCNALSLASGRRPYYRVDGDRWSPDPAPAASGGYRLPTESECRRCFGSGAWARVSRAGRSPRAS